jgi:hypothetical protein
MILPAKAKAKAKRAKKAPKKPTRAARELEAVIDAGLQARTRDTGMSLGR